MTQCGRQLLVAAVACEESRRVYCEHRMCFALRMKKKGRARWWVKILLRNDKQPAWFFSDWGVLVIRTKNK